jgi:hypothetical protein|nr:MAG: hypothetical protein [Caudoviricetes sp.]
MTNRYIPNEEDKKKMAEEIARTASFLNKKPQRQGSNQKLEDYQKPDKK